MKRLGCVIFGLMIGYLGLIVFANRALYFSRFDAVYWKDKYEHSQWKLPLSQRTLGDDGLYLYEGYRLIHGEDPTTLNAEVPPLGKYLIGLSIIMFGNGYVYGLVMSLASVVAFALFTYTLTQTIETTMLTAALLLTDPLISNQFRLTMLDSQHLLFLSLYLLSLRIAARASGAIRLWSVIASGVALGLFAETKFPLLAPFLMVIGFITLYSREKTIRHVVAFLSAATASYLIPYLPYFLQDHSVIDWLRVQKWILSFYAASGIKSTVGSLFTTLLVNQNQNLHSRAYEAVREWSPLWPFITVAGIAQIIRLVRRKPVTLRSPYVPFVAITGFLLVFFSVIPFWTRYLVIVLPLLYLATAMLLTDGIKRHYRLLPYALIAANLAASMAIVFPTPESTVRQFLSDWQHGFFQDMYEALSANDRLLTSRAAFHQFGSRLLYDAHIEDANYTIEPVVWHSFRSPQRVPVRMTYKTRNLGTFTQISTLPLVLENGQWRVSWSWDFLISGLTPDSQLETAIDPARRGGLYAKDGVPLAVDEPSVLVWLLPNRMQNDFEDRVFQGIEKLFDKRILAVHAHERYVRLGFLGKPIPMGVLMRPIDAPTKAILEQCPAITTTKAFGRFIVHNSAYDIGTVANSLFHECCSLLYNTTAYDGRDGLEKTYNQMLKGENGGTLVLKDANGNVVRTIIKKTKRDGHNVRLTE